MENNDQKENSCKLAKIAREHFFCFCAGLGVLIVLFLICASGTSNDCTVAIVKEQGQPPKKIAISDMSAANAALLLREFENTVYQPQPPASAFYAPCTACPVAGHPPYGIYDRVREVANHERAHKLPGVVCPWTSENKRQSYHANIIAWRVAKLEDRIDDIAKGQLKLERMIRRVNEKITANAAIEQKAAQLKPDVAPSVTPQSPIVQQPAAVQQAPVAKSDAQRALEAIQAEYQKLLKMQETLKALKRAEAGASNLYLQMKDEAKPDQKRSAAAPTRTDAQGQTAAQEDQDCPCGTPPVVQSVPSP